jgi:flagellin
MIINHNVTALNTFNRLSANEGATSKSLEKLSSGFRINRAGDDAAGLAISEKMRGQIRGLDMATKNAQDSISLIQTAEGSLNETHSIVQRMRELAVQSSNDTNTDADRKNIQDEITQLKAEVDRIGNTTEFNTKKLLEGSAKGVTPEVMGTLSVNNNSSVTAKVSTGVANSIATKSAVNGAYMLVKVSQQSGATTFNAADYKLIGPDGKTAATTHVAISASNLIDIGTGAGGVALTVGITGGTLNTMKVGESITLVFGKHDVASSTLGGSIMTQIGANSGQTAFISISDMRSKALGIDKIDVSTKFGAQTAIATLDVALSKVSAQRSSMGAIQNRLEHTINNLNSSNENLTAAESRIRDVDMSKEMMAYQKNNILNQAATAMLAQANQLPQGVLQLLK